MSPPLHPGPPCTNNADFFQALSSAQSHRLDDQRVSLASLPGFSQQVPSRPDHMIGGPAPNKQRCSTPQITLTESTPDTARRRLSCHPVATQSSAPQHSPAKVAPDADQGASRTVRSPGHHGGVDQHQTVDPRPESEQLFSLLANTQGRRLDDQRATLPSLSTTHNEKPSEKPSAGGGDAGYLCYMVSKVQGSRMEEQRCSLPQVLNPGLGSSTTRSASFSPGSDIQRPKTKDPENQQPMGQADQDRFLRMMSHAQHGRMDDQRCVLNPSSRSSPSTAPTGPDSEKFFSLLANSQGRRLDDQRVSLPVLPGIRNGGTTSTAEAEDPSHMLYMVSKVQVGPVHSKKPYNPDPEADKFLESLERSQCRRLDDQRVLLPSLPGIGGTLERKPKGEVPARAEGQGSAPHIVLSKGTPVTLRKGFSRPVSPSKPTGSTYDLPKSASFTPGLECQQMLNSSAQGRKNDNLPCDFPEVFLTLGPPGEKITVPLSPAPGRPLSLNLNLVPKETADPRLASPSHASPRKARSRPSTPNLGLKHKSKAPGSHQNEPRKAVNAITPDDDYFSLIEKEAAAARPSSQTRCCSAAAVAERQKKKSGEKFSALLILYSSLLTSECGQKAGRRTSSSLASLCFKLSALRVLRRRRRKEKEKEENAPTHNHNHLPDEEEILRNPY
ncbi:hypothetical protein CRUP_012867 [Coryphaenoides rupestris]|nr:hypothetical protein CRUP_012867 [Coryphaenoides rupestris]